jgi:MarR family transcriptional regulator, transcriptional regulator for hemolysin
VTAPDRLRNFSFLLRDVMRLMTRNFEAQTQGLGLTLPQCKIMAYLSRNAGITQARLAELTDTDPMALVRALDRMEQDGWVERRPSPEDRRAYHLYLLEPARQIVNRIWKHGDQARNEALADLSEQETEQLMQLLERVRTTLSAKYGK